MINAWVDGQPATALSLLDRGLHYGDGVFETISCRDGRLRFADLHWQRLQRGCERLGIPAPDPAVLQREAVRACTAQAGIVKVIVTRGAGGRGYAPPAQPAPTRIVLQYPWPADPAEFWTQGVKVGWSEVQLAHQPALAGIKHLNRLEQVLARAALVGTDDVEALMCDADQRVICGTMSNVFIVDGQRLRTPQLDRAGIAGVMREVLRRECAALGLGFEETDLGRTEFITAAEVFLTNARIGVWPVRRLGGVPLGVGAVTRRVQAHLARLDR
jgi:4-amino-4-deoxychorismate lyase